MSIQVVDTNIVSFFMREDSSLAENYRPLMKGNDLVISFMTVAELYEGAYQAKWGAKRFLRMVRVMDYYEIIYSSLEMSRRWGEIRFQRRQQPISGEDAWIAATALLLDAPLVTHNPKDFRGIRGLQVLTAES